MSELSRFDRLCAQLQQGDEEAIHAIVREYEPELRRFVRVRMTSAKMRRLVDSLDISQSVFAQFFVQLEQGKLNLASPGQLRGLLLTMARNRLLDHVRKAKTGKRDMDRIEGEVEIDRMQDPGHSPSQQLIFQDMAEVIRQHLTEEEQRLLDARIMGRSWQGLASDEGASPEALRKRLTRAVDRVAAKLGVINV